MKVYRAPEFLYSHMIWVPQRDGSKNLKTYFVNMSWNSILHPSLGLIFYFPFKTQNSWTLLERHSGTLYCICFLHLSLPLHTCTLKNPRCEGWNVLRWRLGNEGRPPSSMYYPLLPSSMVRTHLSVILSVCLTILVKIFPHQRKKIIWFGLGGFFLVRKGFSIAGIVHTLPTYFWK